MVQGYWDFQKSMKIIGLDLSLVKTGFTVLKDGKHVSSGLIKSKPSGDKPINELERLVNIVTEIEGLVDGAHLVVIENLAFMARNTTALTQLAGLNYFVRFMLFRKSIPFALVAPTSLKKYVCGKGNADKNIVMMEIFKQYNYSALDDNVADSYGLAVLGHAIMSKSINKPTKPQLEVVALIKQQLC